eukprot:gene7346-467_t
MEMRQSSDQEMLKAIKAVDLEMRQSSDQGMLKAIKEVQSWRPHLGRLQTEMDRLREHLLEVGRIQQTNQASMEQQVLKQVGGLNQRLERHDSVIKHLKGEQATLQDRASSLMQEVSSVQAEIANNGRKVEALGRQYQSMGDQQEEQMKELMQSLSSAEQLSTSQSEGLASYVERVAVHVEELMRSEKKVKKHVLKMQRAQEDLQTLAPAAAAAITASREGRQECISLRSEVNQLLTNVNIAK